MISKRGVVGFLGLVGFTSLLVVSIESCKARKKDSSLQGADDGSDNPYLFTGGACQTSGRWVDAAIQQAERIKSVIATLRDNPKCKSMIGGMDQLIGNPMEAGQGPGADPKGAVAQIFGIGKEITALSQYRRAQAHLNSDFMGPPTEFDANVNKIMTDRMFQVLGLNTDNADAKEPVPGNTPNVAQSSAISEAGLVVDQVISMKTRALRTASAGLDVAATVFNNLGDDQQCLVGRTPEIGTLAIAGAKLLGAYVGADAGLSTKAGAAISAYFKFLQNKRFNDAIRGINQTEFLLSISCLMETTSTNYCSVRDAMFLQQDLLPRVGGLRTTWKHEDNVPDMMTGFKILNQDVPVVADWLRKVVTGVTPRRQSDSAYYNSVMGSANALQQTLTSALTLVAEAKYNLPSDDIAQRQAVLKLATDIQSTFQNFVTQQALPNNFYEMASPPIRQVFDILGMDLPAICDPSITTDTNKLKGYDVYLQQNNYAALASPKTILATMDGNVTRIYQRMSSLLTTFVRNNLNIDQPNVATDFVAPSVSGNALQRIQQIQAYLFKLFMRATKQGKNAPAEDKSFARILMDTIKRINAVVDAQKLILEDADKMFDDGTVDAFIKEQQSRKTVQLALDGGAKNDAEILREKRAKLALRYLGDKVADGDKPMRDAILASNAMFPPENGDPQANPVIKEMANEELAMEKALSIRDPKLRADRRGGAQLGLDEGDPKPTTDGEVNSIGVNTEIYNKLITSAFDQFDMLRFRESFFINRVAKAVYWDLSKQLVDMQKDYAAAQRSGNMAGYNQKWSDVSQKIMTMADNFVVDKLNNTIPKDLQASMLDQSKAAAMNFANLEAMDVFKEALLNRISYLTSLSEGHTTEMQINKDLVDKTIWNPVTAFRNATLGDAKVRKAVFRSGGSDFLGTLANADAAVLDTYGFSYNFAMGTLGRLVRPDLYWSPNYWQNTQHYKDDEFGSLETLRGLLCLQTLAFADPINVPTGGTVLYVFPKVGILSRLAQPFKSVCKGAVLRSVFEPKGSVNPTNTVKNPDALSLNYDEWIAEYERTKNLNDMESKKFQARRICAVYDNLRNNSIHMMKLRNMTDNDIKQSLPEQKDPFSEQRK